MALYLQLVFGLLVIEIGIFLLLCIPLPARYRAQLVMFITKSALASQVMYFLQVIFLFVLLLVVDSVNRMFRAQAELGEHINDAHREPQLKSKLFYSQRNMYLCGGTLLLSLILNRFMALLKKLGELDEKGRSIAAQTTSGNKAYIDLLEKYETLRKQASSSSSAASSSGPTSEDIAILKKQSEENYKQYMELADRNAELERTIERLKASGAVEQAEESKTSGRDEGSGLRARKGGNRDL